MDKNSEHNDQKAVSKAVAHDMESSDTIFATQYLDPPPLFAAADPKHVKEELEGEEKEQKESPAEISDQTDQTNSPEPVANDPNADAAIVKANAPQKEDEKEEEIMDAESVDLVFADDIPEPPNDEGDDENGAAGGAEDGSNGDDGNNPNNNDTSQFKPASEDSITSPGKNKNGIPPELMSKIEAVLGADLSNVKIHTQSQKASEVGALAFTTGNSIAFAPGKFNPSTMEGKRLIGHEFAHVVQQRQGMVKPTTLVSGMPVNDDEALENDADNKGDEVAKLSSPLSEKKEINAKASLTSSDTSQLKEDDTIQREQPAEDKDTPPEDPTSLPSSTDQPANDDLVCLPDASTEKPQEVPVPNAAPTPTSNSSDQPATNATPAPPIAEEKNEQVVIPGNENEIDKTNVDSGVDWGKFWADNKLNIGRTVAEPFRLIPVWGLFPGFAADIMETLGDLDTAKPANDKLLDFLVAIRAPVVIMHNMFGHFAYIGELAQDVAVGSILGIELAVFTGPFNETMNGIKSGLLVAQTVIDASVVARTLMEVSDASHSQEELDAYKATFAGFEANLAMDGLDLILTGLSMGTAGLANGSVISQGARVSKNVLKQKALFKSLSTNILTAWAGVWGGNAVDSVLPDPVSQQKEDDSEPIQKQSSGEELARHVAGELILIELSKIEGAYNVGTGLINHAADEVQSIGDNIDKLSEVLTDEKAVPALKNAMNKGLDFLTTQLTGLQQTHPFITTSAQKATQLNELLDGVLVKIASIPLLVATPSDNDFIPDIIEEAGAAAANKLLNQVNKLIKKAKEDATAAVNAIKANAEEIAEFLHTLIGVLGDQIEFVKAKILVFKDKIKDLDSLSDIVDMLMKEVSEWLGIDPPLSTTVLKEGWEDLHATIQGGFTMARAMVNENVKGQASQGKFEEEEESIQRKEELNLSGLISQENEVKSVKDEVSNISSTKKGEDIGAQAYSKGISIFQDPTNIGTLAHEAFHVVQQKTEAYSNEVNGTETSENSGSDTIQRFPNPLDWASEQYEEVSDWASEQYDSASDWYNEEKSDHYNRNEQNQLPDSEPVGDPAWRLLPDSESVYHQNGEDARGNRKYVSTDGGHFEAVYDSEGNLVTDDANQGTYNHHGPDNKWDHWKEDVLPYWLWGNTEDDDTPLGDRLVGPRLGERIGEYAGGKWQDAKDGAGELWEGAKETATETWDSVSETASETWESTKDTASETWETVSDGASETWDNVSEGATDTWDSVKDTASDTWESVSDGASSAWDSLSGVFGGNDDPVQQKEDSGLSVDKSAQVLPPFQLKRDDLSTPQSHDTNKSTQDINQLKKIEEEEVQVQMKEVPNVQLKEEANIDLKSSEISQLKDKEEEEEIQLKDKEEEEELQMKPDSENSRESGNSANGMTDFIPSGVNVHKESSKATEMGALAYAQGTDIHFAPGQYNPKSRAGQELIGHELHHVVQQKQGRVKPTTQKNGKSVNDDKGLEKEADDYGVKFANSLQSKPKPAIENNVSSGFALGNAPLQKKENPDSTAPMQLKETASAGGAGGGTSEGSGPISIDASQTAVKGLLTSAPLPLFEKIKTAPDAINTAMNSESTELKGSFPNIEQPTGIENQPLAEGTGEDGTVTGPHDLPNYMGYAGQGGSGDTTVPEGGPINRGPNADIAMATPPSPVPTANVAPPSSTSLTLGDETVDYSAGAEPKVDTSGEADPAQLTTSESSETSNVQGELSTANTEIGKDHGEDDIYPHYAELENLTPEIEIPQGQQVPVPEMEEISERSAEVDAGFNAQAQEKLDQDMAEHVEANEAQVLAMNDGSQEEWTTYETSKTEEEARVIKEQETAQSDAQTEVDTQKQNWQTENDAVKAKFVTDASVAKTDYKGQIDGEINTADSDVANTFNQAEIDAQKEADEAQRQADAKEAESDDGGFDPIGFAVSVVSKGLDWLKKQFNKIIDVLKQAVDIIIEAAKTVANTIIEAARRAITSLIRAFGEFLKTLVDIAFAAFPEIRDRIKDAIDSTVEVAVEAVNTLADGLKDFVNALLDALGAALKFLLDTYQKFINALISIIKFIVVGLYELYKGITNLALSAKQSPGQFMGQLQEEFLGMNLSDKLPFERDVHPDPSYFRPPVAGDAMPSIEGMPPILEKDPLSASDIEVTSITENAGPELSEDIINTIPDGGEREFGGSGVDELDLLRQEYAIPESAEGAIPEGGQEMTEADSYPYAHLADDPQARSDAELDNFLGNQPSPDGASASKDSGGAQADSAAIDDSMKIGPFTSGQRFRYLRTQMWNGIKSWFSANKVAIIAGVVAAVVAGIALMIVTGGAVTALIPPLMTILGAFFLGEALVKAGNYIRLFLSKAWGGGAGLADGAKDFARAMVIMVVELIFILLFDLNTVIKAAKAGLKSTVRSATKSLKTTGRTLREGVRDASIRTTARNTRETIGRAGTRVLDIAAGGRTLVKEGLSSGYSRGVRTVSDLMERVKSLKFKKFKLVRSGNWFRLYGQVNPWVLLATGSIEFVEQADIVKKGGDDGAARVGNMVMVDGTEGVVVGVRRNPSRYVNNLQENASAGDNLTGFFDDLAGKADDLGRKTDIQGKPAVDWNAVAAELGEESATAIRQSSGRLANNLPNKPPNAIVNAHHLIPVSLISKIPVLRKAIESGFDFNGAINGRWLSKFSDTLGLRGIHATHPTYTKRILEQLQELEELFSRGYLTASEALEGVENIARNAGKLLDQNSTIASPFKVDDIFENMDEIIKQSDEIAASHGTARVIKFKPSSGTEILTNPDKTTTLLGRWVDDMENIKGEMAGGDFNVGTGHGPKFENGNGFNFLDIPKSIADGSDDFFGEFNMPWLTEAITRGDDIVLATKPNRMSDIISPDTGELKGMFAQELKFLVDNNYRPTNITDAEWRTITSWFK